MSRHLDHCVCKPAPEATVFKTLKKDTPLGDLWHNHAWTGLMIPKGTRCKLITDGTAAGKFFIDDLSWMDKTDKPVGIVKHDATYYGIMIDASEVE